MSDYLEYLTRLVSDDLSHLLTDSDEFDSINIIGLNDGLSHLKWVLISFFEECPFVSGINGSYLLHSNKSYEFINYMKDSMIRFQLI